MTTHDHSELQATLDQILAEQRKTNGRVGRLETRAQETDKVLYGDDRRQDSGLVASAHAADEMVRQWNNLQRVLRIAALWLGAATVTGVVNIALGLL